MLKNLVSFCNSFDIFDVLLFVYCNNIYLSVSTDITYYNVATHKLQAKLAILVK